MSEMPPLADMRVLVLRHRLQKVLELNGLSLDDMAEHRYGSACQIRGGMWLVAVEKAPLGQQPRLWTVTESGGQWDPFPFPEAEAEAPSFDEKADRNEYLRGKDRSRASAAEVVRDLVGETV